MIDNVSPLPLGCCFYVTLNPTLSVSMFQSTPLACSDGILLTKSSFLTPYLLSWEFFVFHCFAASNRNWFLTSIEALLMTWLLKEGKHVQPNICTHNSWSAGSFVKPISCHHRSQCLASTGLNVHCWFNPERYFLHTWYK